MPWDEASCTPLGSFWEGGADCAAGEIVGDTQIVKDAGHPEITLVAAGLQFPEGPVALADGSVLVVEIARGTLTRIASDGRRDIVAELGAGPNGAAIGQDGACYICNNGGFTWSRDADQPRLVDLRPPVDQGGGRIERVELETGRVERLYEACDGRRLAAPNDLVFDAHGGFYFTDSGKHDEFRRDRGFLYYAKADGSQIQELTRELITPNGVALSPDERTVYVSETVTGRLWALEITAPGKIRAAGGLAEPIGRLVVGLPGYQLFDSMAVDSAGYICVATVGNGGISRCAPDGGSYEHIPLPDPITTNICFGGHDLRTAWITLSQSGRLVSMQWPVPGLKLNNQTVPSSTGAGPPERREFDRIGGLSADPA